MLSLWCRCRSRAAATAAYGAALIGILLAMQSPAFAQAWTLTKTPSPTTYTAAGQIINYTYVITNNTGGTGSYTTFTDTKVTLINCPSNTVPPNGTLTCTGSYTIVSADVTAGSVTNTATVTGDSCGDGCRVTAQATAVVNLVPQPSWALTKTPSPTTYTAAGQVIITATC